MGDSSGGWIVMESKDGHGEVTYHNTTTDKTKTLEQMLDDGWVELDEETHDKYKYPALYDPTTHDVLIA